MMKSYLLPLALINLIGLTGCVIIADENPLPTPVVADENKNSQEIAIGNALLETIKNNDYKAFSDVLGNDFEGKISEVDFNTSQENFKGQFGTIIGYEYLTQLKTPLVDNLIWTVTFERKGEDGKMISQQLMFRLICGTLDGKIKVISFGFL